MVMTVIALAGVAVAFVYGIYLGVGIAEKPRKKKPGIFEDKDRWWEDDGR